jgi:hypothetical protein
VSGAVHTPGRTRQAANCDTSVAADIAGDPFAYAKLRWWSGEVDSFAARVDAFSARVDAAIALLDARGDRPC